LVIDDGVGKAKRKYVACDPCSSSQIDLNKITTKIIEGHEMGNASDTFAPLFVLGLFLLETKSINSNIFFTISRPHWSKPHITATDVNN
jgi:hypothetical protein